MRGHEHNKGVASVWVNGGDARRIGHRDLANLGSRSPRGARLFVVD